MKQSEESYLDSLLKNVSVDDDNSFETMLNNDANSFGKTDIEAEELDLNDNMQDEDKPDIEPDLGDIDDLGSWDDFDSMSDVSSVPKALLPEGYNASQELEEPVTKDDAYIAGKPGNKEELNNSLNGEITENLLDEIQSEEVQEAEEESPFEENLMEELLSDEDTSAYSLPDEMEADDQGNLSQSEEEKDLFGEDEVEPDMNNDESNPLGDVEDLLGMLNSESEQEESTSDDLFGDLDGSIGQGEEDGDDIFSLDDILGSDEEETPSPQQPEPDMKDALISDELEEKFFESENSEKADKPEKKAGFFARIFGNVHDEKAKKAAKKKPNVPLDEEGNPIKKPKKSDAEIKAEKAEKKKAQEEKKKLQAARKAEAKALKDAKRKEREEAKKAKLLEEVEIDEGRINRVGASIVFAFFGIITAVIVLGTDNFSYSQSVKKATEYFGTQKYNNAYNEVRGIEVKNKDLEIYDKIMTVMFVNKQLNSYNNYYNMDKYPEALDSLLKGLQRYDEYVSLAKELGIKSDLDYVRNQILGELSSIFQLSEEEAYRIIDNNDDMGIYSQRVIEAASIN